MRPLWFVLPLLLTLAACDDPDTPAPSTADAPAAQPAATEVREGLAGIWRPRGESDLNALVLEDQGQLYLVGDGERRGLRWEKATDDAVTLHYLSGGDTLTEDDLRVSLDNPSLTLEGESPLAGEYRRDPAGIGTLEGRVTLPEAGAVPDNGVLVLTLRDLSASDGEGDGQLARRLTRLSLEGDMSMPFRLYFDQARVNGDHRYGLDARVIADGATLLALPAPRRVLANDGQRQDVTLPLSPTSASAGLINTYWKLERVGERAAPPPVDQAAQAHLVLHRDGDRLKGATGCNTLQGQYQTDGNGLTLSNLTRTEKACTGDNVADAFVAALENTRRYQVQGQRLTLLDDQGEPLAVLRAEYLY
ncbi:META domain-containing protein [Alloalcanivorax marinus]|uniref:META domain-containing protein n=1 Tax=Alloalcanivorax marinus TaxID=1177169 RepID=UPI0019312401|nr:META domain-containing protein [Alloalcanivorax marinus]MBL7252440.1 META domain-containing protein [Alloalcanivorax marinus]